MTFTEAWHSRRAGTSHPGRAARLPTTLLAHYERGKKSRWLVVRARIADGIEDARGCHFPGELVWVVGEKRRGGEMKSHVTNHAAGISKTQIVRDIKSRWACETLHAQAKEELGLDHFEGRSWRGLTHHVMMVMLAMLFLQTGGGLPTSLV